MEKFSVYLNRRVFVMESAIVKESSVFESFITKTHLFKYIENFTTKKGKFSDKKNLIFFHIPAQNIDCGTC